MKLPALLRHKLFLSLIFLALAGSAALLWKNARSPDAASRYRTQAVERGDLSQLASANGTLNPVTVVNVGTQVSGTVRKWFADFNDRVSAGQKLLELDPALLEAQLAQSEANLTAARAQLQLAEANAARAEELFRQEYVSRQEVDVARQALAAARAQVALVSAQRRKDSTNLGYSIIRSPVAGVVVSREVDVGQTVAANFQTPTLFKIAQDLSQMQINSSFAEADIGQIKVGQSATFRVDAFPDRVFSGSVKQVRLNPTTVQNVVTYDVVITLDNPDHLLLPGMTAYVNILVAEKKDVLLVPNAALRFRPADTTAAGGKSAPGRKGAPVTGEKRSGPGGTVYRLVNGQPQALRVQTGITNNRQTEIVGGELQAGDLLIVEDQQAPVKGKNGAGGPPGPRLL